MGLHLAIERRQGVVAQRRPLERLGRVGKIDSLLPGWANATGTFTVKLTPQPAVGFSEASYGELPAEDMIPILLPWQDKKTRYVWKSGKFAKSSTKLSIKTAKKKNKKSKK